MYNRLERDFIDTSSYVALSKIHGKVWSERFGELLTRTGDLVDSFFRFMVNCRSLDNEKTVIELREKMKKKRQREMNWHPNITDFGKAFEPIFRLSSAQVEAEYGLTHYGRLQPFKDFGKKSPFWWIPYNKVKHEIFEQIEQQATLENTINALAGLFILNILHKESQRYLILHTNVINFHYLTKRETERQLMKSMIGIPKAFHGWEITAETPLFIHFFRVDEKVETAITIADGDLEDASLANE